MFFQIAGKWAALLRLAQNFLGLRPINWDLLNFNTQNLQRASSRGGVEMIVYILPAEIHKCQCLSVRMDETEQVTKCGVSNAHTSPKYHGYVACQSA